ncbi:hypothetical protein D9757_006485 [Collybiopsis confluens]|uniref:Uncharacterized protein n=1 Tax=Collybiopsis confluens TaxID=2823264 RepID=A0A8H5M8A5_9AGAR|nr:hypothetical protein D9757_006485 [Collybiopsis confluens]
MRKFELQSQHEDDDLKPSEYIPRTWRYHYSAPSSSYRLFRDERQRLDAAYIRPIEPRRLYFEGFEGIYVPIDPLFQSEQHSRPEFGSLPVPRPEFHSLFPIIDRIILTHTIDHSPTPSLPHFTPPPTQLSPLSAETPRASRQPSYSLLNPGTQLSLPSAHLSWRRCQRITKDGIWAAIPRWDVQNPDLNMPAYTKPDWARGVQALAARFHQGDLNDELLSVHRRKDIEARSFSSPRSASGATEYSVTLELVGTTQRTSKKHLERWIYRERGALDCDVTGCWPCEAAHVIEKRYSLKARVAIYYALGGWISPNLRLNFFYLRGDIHKRLDLHTLFVYLTDEDLLDLLYKYLTHHPSLCDGTAFKYAIANKKNTRGDFCFKRAYPNSDLNGLEFESYSHPLVVLVRMCAMFDELVRQDNRSSWEERAVFDYFDIDKRNDPLCRIINRNMALITRLRRMIPSDLEWFKKKRRAVQSLGDVFSESDIPPPGGQEGITQQRGTVMEAEGVNGIAG